MSIPTMPRPSCATEGRELVRGRWGMPPSSKPLFDAVIKPVSISEAKGILAKSDEIETRITAP
jgi:hypothetical protein